MFHQDSAFFATPAEKHAIRTFNRFKSSIQFEFHTTLVLAFIIALSATRIIYPEISLFIIPLFLSLTIPSLFYLCTLRSASDSHVIRSPELLRKSKMVNFANMAFCTLLFILGVVGIVCSLFWWRTAKELEDDFKKFVSRSLLVSFFWLSLICAGTGLVILGVGKSLDVILEEVAKFLVRTDIVIAEEVNS